MLMVILRLLMVDYRAPERQDMTPGSASQVVVATRYHACFHDEVLTMWASEINEAAAIIGAADGLLITAGAGMGVDSGLPDFRGDEGFWRAYPALGAAGLRFHEIANPASFRATPDLGWGFYGHRFSLYSQTVPHSGFAILRDMAATMTHGCFIFTSNVDGQFQAAGFDPARMVECHGAIHQFQCLDSCTAAIWEHRAPLSPVDPMTCRMQAPLPACPHCKGLARPNILMFNDSEWLPQRSDAQQDRFDAWRARVRRLAVIELGAGTAIPSVRRFGEGQGAPLIRINKREADVAPGRGLGLPLGAREALCRIRDASIRA